ncbi:MAG TPA: DUF2336 domain-containing protein [Sphingomonas sp.]|nr:DUF2336 domain-containing protein [Sphingomonas sp.]
MALSALEGGEAAPSGPDRLLADAAQVARQADARLTAALHDLFLPDFVRPTDSQRAAMAQMLDGLVRELERELRASLVTRLGPEAPPVLEVERIPILRPIFDRAGVLRDRDLVGLLLTRAEECRIGQTIRRVADLNPREAAAVRFDAPEELQTALLTAEVRRFGDMGEPRFALADLPAELLHRLLWRAAAALRDYLERSSSLNPALRDEALAAAVGERMAAHDEGRSLAAVAMRLALTTPADDLLLVELFQGGRFSLFAAMLAVRARLEFGPAFLLAADPTLGALAVLLRAIEVPTQAAAPILLQMAAVNGLSDLKLEERVNDFLDLDADAAREAIRPWQLDRAFRDAIADIGRERRAQ